MRLRHTIPPGDMGEKRQKENCVALHQSPEIRNKILQKFSYHRGIQTAGRHSQSHRLIRCRQGRDDTLKNNLRIALTAGEDVIDTIAIENRIKELNAVMLGLVQISVRLSASADYLDDKFKEISDEIEELQDTLKNHEQRQTIAQNTRSRMDEIFKILQNENFNLAEYNKALVRQLVDSVKVISDSKILITFKGGLEMEQALSGNF